MAYELRSSLSGPAIRAYPGSVAGKAETARDEHALNFGGALADLQDLGVPVEPGDGVFLHEAVAAEDLRGDPRRGNGRLTRVELGDRGGLLHLLDGAPAGGQLVLEPGGSVGQQPGSLSHDGEVADLEADPLVRGDRPAEGEAALAVGHALLQ